MKKIENKNLLKFLNDQNIFYNDIYALKNDASTRNYYRGLENKKSFLIMDSSHEKNSLVRFVKISKWLQNNSYSAPKIYSKNLANGYCALEDFGDLKFSKIKKSDLFEKYKLTIDLLLSLSFHNPPEYLKFYSKNIFIEELNIFIDWFLYHSREKNSLVIQSWNMIWESYFKSTLNYKRKVLVLRDFHIDNLFWLNEREGIKKIGLIDFQDALAGHPCYDLVSLLQDVRINLSDKMQKTLYNYYLKKSTFDKKQFEESYYIFGTQRLIKIIGVFYRLKYLYKKDSYMKYIPRTWLLLKENLKYPSLRLIKNWFDKYVF